MYSKTFISILVYLLSNLTVIWTKKFSNGSELKFSMKGAIFMNILTLIGTLLTNSTNFVGHRSRELKGKV